MDTEGGVFKEAPPKTVNHADHWIEHKNGLKKRRQFRSQHIRPITHGRDVQTKLNDKWQNIFKIAVFDIECCDVQTDAKRTEKSQ